MQTCKDHTTKLSWTSLKIIGTYLTLTLKTGNALTIHKHVKSIILIVCDLKTGQRHKVTSTNGANGLLCII